MSNKSLLHALLRPHERVLTDAQPSTERLVHIRDDGDDQRNEQRLNDEDQKQPLSTHAVLYVLDAQDGRELWSSRDQIATWNHWSGLGLANGQVYINTFDGTIYCFGLPK